MRKREIEIFNSTLKKINSLYNSELKNKFSNSKISTFYSFNRNFSGNSTKRPKSKFQFTPKNKKVSSIIKNNSEYNIIKDNNINNILIDNILNKKLKIKTDEIDTIEDIKRKFGKNIFVEKYEKLYRRKERPLHYCLKKSKKLNNIKSFDIYNSNKYRNYKLLNKPTYETIEFNEKKLLYANKLKFDEKYKNSMEYPKNIIGNLSWNRTNFKSLSNNSKRKDTIKKEFSLNDLKIMNIKKIEKMRKQKYISLKKSIIESNEIIRNNRIKYNSFIEKISNIFNKQVEEIKNNNL